MSRLKVFSAVLLSMLCFNSLINAQADCPTIVTAALDTATDACTGLGRNQACYGNVTLQATARADAPAFSFEQAGDMVNVTNIDSLQLSSMSLTDETWGVALMQLQANLPDTLPGQNVTVLLFGNVQITNAAIPVIELNVTATDSVNVRLRPITTENNIISSLTRGQTIIANGRLADNSWIRIITNADTHEVGWVSSAFVTSDVDLETLTVVESNEPLFAPMQAFYFGSGIGDRPCDEAPDSGILIQTPEGIGEINLLINEVDIRLGSTVYLQAGGGVMTTSVLEGHAVLTTNGVSQTVPAGTYSEIPLDTTGVANGAPNFPQPYIRSDLMSLPITVLPQTITISRPIRRENDIQEAITIAEGIQPSGSWIFTYTVTEDSNCAAPGEHNTEPLGYVHPGAYVTLTFTEDRQTLIFDGYGYSNLMLSNIGEDAYQYSDGMWTLTIDFSGPTTFDIFQLFAYPAPESCIHNWNGTGTYVG
jgi:hypothetical protein